MWGGAHRLERGCGERTRENTEGLYKVAFNGTCGTGYGPSRVSILLWPSGRKGFVSLPSLPIVPKRSEAHRLVRNSTMDGSNFGMLDPALRPSAFSGNDDPRKAAAILGPTRPSTLVVTPMAERRPTSSASGT